MTLKIIHEELDISKDSRLSLLFLSIYNFKKQQNYVFMKKS